MTDAATSGEDASSPGRAALRMHASLRLRLGRLLALALLAPAVADTRADTPSAPDRTWENLMASAVRAQKAGALADAVGACERAMALAASPGRGDTRQARSRLLLGEILRETDAPAAERSFVAAVHGFEAAVGPTSADVVVALESLANFYESIGRLEDAATARERIVALVAAAGDPRELARRKSHLAQVRARQARYADADALDTEAMALAERAGGPDDPDVRDHALAAAEANRAWGRYERADALARRALASATRAAGRDSLEAALCLDRLGAIHLEWGRAADAEAFARRALAIAERAGGPDSSDLAPRLALLAAAVRAQGRVAEAAAPLRRALALAERDLGPEAPDVLALVATLADVVRALGRAAEADALQARTRRPAPHVGVEGTLVPPDAEPLPTSLELELTRAGAEPFSIPCPIVENRWNCEVPGGRADLELRVAGYAPVHLRDVALGTTPGTLGPSVLRRGAAVAGRVETPDGSAAAACSVALLAGTRRGRRSFGATSDARGLFQVVAPAGEYELRAQCSSGEASRDVTLSDRGETRLPPIVLEANVLDVRVRPPVDPRGRRWTIALRASAPRWRVVEERGDVPADGRWTRGGLAAGDYELRVADRDGAEWGGTKTALRAGAPPVVVDLAPHAIAGRVALGAQPLAAELVFTDDARRVSLRSGDDGVFHGTLPGGIDASRRWNVEIHAAQPPVDARLDVAVPPGDDAWIDLGAPADGVRGVVETPAGSRVPGALVTIEGGDRWSRASTDGAGVFEAPDLPAGAYRATATAVGGASEPIAFTVGASAPEELRLVLSPSRRFTVVIASDSGPVAGAAVQTWLPPGLQHSAATTDDDGLCAVDIPAEAAEIGLTIAAPGRPLTMTRVRVVDGEPATLTLASAAGRLVLGDADLDGAVVVHGGVVESAATFARWAEQNGGARVAGGLLVPQVEPGSYALCRVAPEDVAALWTGGPSSDRCVSGRLDVGDVLRLARR